MSNIPISALYRPDVVVYASHAAAVAAGETVTWNPDNAPQYWKAKLADGFDPDAPYTIHNLHPGNGGSVWGVSYIPNSQAVTLNIPPDSTGPNAPVYPASVPIPMTYPLAPGITVLETPFGMQVSDNSNPLPVDPTLAAVKAELDEVLADVRDEEKRMGGTPQ